jgi:hypothetical protein
MRWTTLLGSACLLSVVACATGAPPGAGDDQNQRPDAQSTPIDAPPGTIDAPPIDAPPIDAMPIDAMPIDAMPIDGPPQPVNVTLNESTSSTITAQNTVACASGTTGYTRDNSFWRMFPMTALGVAGQMTVNNVTIGIEDSEPGGSTQTVTVNLYTLTGAMETGTRTLLRSQNVSVGAVSAVSFPVAISPAVVVPAGSQLVVEVHSNDGNSAGNIFYLGSNAAGESYPSYLSSSVCSQTTPATFASLGYANVQLVMSVSGTTP